MNSKSCLGLERVNVHTPCYCCPWGIHKSAAASYVKVPAHCGKNTACDPHVGNSCSTA